MTETTALLRAIYHEQVATSLALHTVGFFQGMETTDAAAYLAKAAETHNLADGYYRLADELAKEAANDA